jgi:hypothetical protein
LNDVGEKLKVASNVIQLLSGNMRTSNQTPLIFDDTTWKKTGGYGITRAQDSKERINKMLFKLINTVDEEDETDKKHINRLKTNYYKKTSNFQLMLQKEDWKILNEENQKFFGDDIGGKYFSNTDAVWNVLKNYK